jgi:hypothetical protein
MISSVLLTAVGLLGYAAEPITVYDLRYALKYDSGNPQQVAAAWDHVHTVATLQGIVNRDGANLYVLFVGDGDKSVDQYWLGRMSEPGQWLANRKRSTVTSLPALVSKFRKAIKGAVVYDPAVPATSNLASTIAGVENLIAVRFDRSPGSLYSQLITSGPRLPVVKRLVKEDGSPLFTGKGTIADTQIPSTGSAKCDAYLWLKHHYIDTGKVDAGYAGFYIDSYWQTCPTLCSPNQHTLTNHDFFVAKKAFFFDLNVWADETPVDDRNQKPGTDLETLKALLKSAYDKVGKKRMIHIGGFTPWAFKYTSAGKAGGKHEPVPTEWETAKLIGAYNAFIDADAIGLAAMANASFYMHFPLKKEYPQHWVKKQQLISRGLLKPDGQVNFDGRQFMIFYVGDYDSAAWLYQHMPSAWDSPARGKLPLMWCVSPVLERRAPMALDYLRRTASENDYFAASDNGAGYLDPGMLQEPREISGLPSGLETWAEHCSPIYKRWDVTITGFIIDGYAPGLNKDGLDCYAKFSPNGIVPQKIPATLLHGDMPVLRASYDLGDNAEQAAKVIVERVGKRTVPFNWFRAILKSPEWYVDVYNRVRAVNPKIELLDAPTYFELYRAWLQSNPQAAAGKIDCER